jgi:hypothetical protein
VKKKTTGGSESPEQALSSIAPFSVKRRTAAIAGATPRAARAQMKSRAEVAAWKRTP